ncbi:MAG: STN domain-containing protein, partial [Planctomycetes bacterium]|nr:STN domain-containing protein [Planctomycetota bacterium]
MKTTTALLAMALAAWAGDTREDSVRKLETMKVTVDFEDVRLPEAVDYLRDVTGLNLVILPKAMEKDGESKIRLKVKDLSVKSVLRLLLATRGLTATYRDGAIVIVPKDELQDTTTMKMFDVRALQVKIQDFDGPIVELTSPASKKSGIVVTTLSEPQTRLPDDVLLDMIRVNTGNGTWD